MNAANTLLALPGPRSAGGWLLSARMMVHRLGLVRSYLARQPADLTSDFQDGIS
ncbi:hypothetical protein [Streptomyces sp. NPDC018833]|uniref:hypothetical protein n=1 Tax=Streptomyces sp. NPDC018833 TaxID=3365053 RepID=UPI0037AA07B9